MSPERPKPSRRKVITRDKGQNEEAEEDEQEEAADDMTERSNSYVREIHLRSSPRHSLVTRKTYGKTAALRTGLEETEENDNSAGGSTASDVLAASNGPLLGQPPISIRECRQVYRQALASSLAWFWYLGSGLQSYLPVPPLYTL